ncbi:MAG: peptidylprolyl isomerase [Candidatus Omnitrophica bacterium]|nr:peptidylprolyl isomerase [Candidatus Omnitrophota bacterium]MDD5737682.1 peptidylprolyl isomerase [Candidatus Omnitrophota bacterium]
MMRKAAFMLALALLSAPVLCGASPAPETAAANKILVVVNDEVLTQSDLDFALNQISEELKREYSGAELAAKIEEARKEYLNQMIEDKLILQQAKKLGVIVDDSEVEEQFKQVKSKFPSEDIFYAEVQKAGISTEVLKKRYRENIMMGKLVSHEVKDKVVVTPSEIDDYYKKHSAELKAPEAVRIRSIMLRFGGEQSEDAVKQKSYDILKLIKEGRDFGELAKLYSEGLRSDEGGDFGFVERGQMRDDFDKVIFSMKEGEVSEPLRADTGYFIFKAEQKRDARALTIQEAHDGIENIIYREKAQQRYKDWIAKLKRDAFIQIK